MTKAKQTDWANDSIETDMDFHKIIEEFILHKFQTSVKKEKKIKKAIIVYKPFNKPEINAILLHKTFKAKKILCKAKQPCFNSNLKPPPMLR